MSWQLTQLRLSIGARPLIEGLDLQVQAGQRWAVLGVNGCGKSTVLRVLAGLPLSDAMTLRTQARSLFGQSLATASLPVLARQRAVLPQHAEIAAHTVAGHVLELAGQTHAQANTCAQDWHVQYLLTQSWGSLSGGERARLLLAACAAQETPCVLLDEPFAAMDLGEALAACTRVCGWGKTVVAVLHDVNLAQRLATHALLFLPGGQWAAGPVEAVFTAPLLSRCLAAPVHSVISQGQRVWHAA
jgi:iron complex transport system ATP-binding protein